MNICERQPSVTPVSPPKVAVSRVRAAGAPSTSCVRVAEPAHAPAPPHTVTHPCASSTPLASSHVASPKHTLHDTRAANCGLCAWHSSAHRARGATPPEAWSCLLYADGLLAPLPLGRVRPSPPRSCLLMPCRDDAHGAPSLRPQVPDRRHAAPHRHVNSRMGTIVRSLSPPRRTCA